MDGGCLVVGASHARDARNGSDEVILFAAQLILNPLLDLVGNVRAENGLDNQWYEQAHHHILRIGVKSARVVW